MSDADFEAAVADALDSVPGELLEMMDNVAFFIEEEPDSELEPDTLGVYEGVALTERGWDWGGPVLPDRIVIFRGPTLRWCESPAEVVAEVRVTVIHEIAHHFGIDDDRLHELGWD